MCCDLSSEPSHVLSKVDGKEAFEYARFSIKKAYNAFEWTPSIDLKAGLKKIIQNQ